MVKVSQSENADDATREFTRPSEGPARIMLGTVDTAQSAILRCSLRGGGKGTSLALSLLVACDESPLV